MKKDFIGAVPFAFIGGGIAVAILFGAVAHDLVAPLFGLPFVLVGVGIIAFRRQRAAFIERLKRDGVRVIARVSEVTLNSALQVNGKSPFRIVAQSLDPATNELHIYESRNIWFDPTEFLGGGEVTVYVERGSKRRYYMDTSFLPSLVR